LGAKYATLFLARLCGNGELEYVNCGHVPPLHVTNEKKVTRLENSNFPVGLLPEATYEAGRTKLQGGDRLVLVTDGVTEAENDNKEFFGDERLEEAAGAGASPFQGIFDAVRAFCGTVPLSDDCTVFELTYRTDAPQQQAEASADATAKSVDCTAALS
jgi:serine phosphatase RsbU (regulator of sigma subunit)